MYSLSRRGGHKTCWCPDFMCSKPIFVFPRPRRRLPFFLYLIMFFFGFLVAPSFSHFFSSPSLSPTLPSSRSGNGQHRGMGHCSVRPLPPISLWRSLGCVLGRARAADRRPLPHHRPSGSACIVVVSGSSQRTVVVVASVCFVVGFVFGFRKGPLQRAGPVLCSGRAVRDSVGTYRFPQCHARVVYSSSPLRLLVTL